MTNKEALAILDTIPTIGEQVDALEMAIEALQERKWNVIKKRSMTKEEREEWSEKLGYEITDGDGVIYCNLPKEGEEVLITTKWGSVTIDTVECDDGVYFENYDSEDVIAWMPKPKPYKEADE